MASLSTAKVLGGVGGILAIIPGISLVGWILILVAMKEISDVTQDRSIFDDALIAGIAAVIGAVTFVVLLASGAFWGVITLGAIDFGVFGVLGALALLGTFWFLLTVSSVFLKRAYDKISTPQCWSICNRWPPLPDRSPNRDRACRIPNTTHSNDLPDRRILLHPGSTFTPTVSWIPATPADADSHPTGHSATGDPSSAGARVQVLLQMRHRTPCQRRLLYQLWNQAIVAIISYRSHLSWPGARDTQISTNATTHFRRFLKIMSTAVRGSYQRGSGTLQWVDGGMWPRWRGRILSLS